MHLSVPAPVPLRQVTLPGLHCPSSWRHGAVRAATTWKFLDNQARIAVT
jgi:hypothetical protein